MITAELYLAYVLACMVILIVPGPTILLVVTYALRQGRRAAIWTVTGVGLGDLTAMIMSLVGLGALLAISAELFLAVKWLGAAYLVYLGIRLWREPHPTSSEDVLVNAPSGRSMLLQAWLVTALNPKGIIFFVAFLPQFVDPAGRAAPQLALLGAAFLALAIANAAAYALAAGRLSARLRHARFYTWVNRIGGSVLIGAGVMTAFSGNGNRG